MRSEGITVYKFLICRVPLVQISIHIRYEDQTSSLISIAASMCINLW